MTSLQLSSNISVAKTLEEEKVTIVLPVPFSIYVGTSTFVLIGIEKQELKRFLELYAITVNKSLNDQIKSHKNFYLHSVIAVIVDSDETAAKYKDFIGSGQSVVLWHKFQTWYSIHQELGYV